MTYKRIESDDDTQRAARVIFAACKDGSLAQTIEASPRLSAAVDSLWFRSGHEGWDYARYLVELNKLVSDT